MKIKAKYCEDEFIPDLNGNPLVEALSFMDTGELLEKLTYVYAFPDNFSKAPQYAKEYLLKKLKATHIPQPIQPEFYSTVTSSILDRYGSYHPFSAEHRRKLNQLAEAVADKELSFDIGQFTTASSSLIDGQSGSGKTTMIRNTLNMLPQVIEHNNYKGKPFRQDQLVWVSFDLPATASPKAMALNFFKAVDTAIDFDQYYKEWSKKSSGKSVDSHLNAMRLVAESHHLGIVHIDEIQFMLKYPQSKGTEKPSLSVLEALFNKIGVPVLLSTTTQGLALFDTANGENQFVDMTTTRRMLSERQYTCKLHKANSTFFEQLFEALFPPQICIEGKIPSYEFKLQFHHHSCGLPSMMVRLAHLHHETTYRRLNKSQNGNTCIRTDDITSLNKTYNKQFKLIHPALESLRAGNELAFEKQVISRGGIKKFFDEATEKEGRKRLKRLSNVTAPPNGKRGIKSKTSSLSGVSSKYADEISDFEVGVKD